MGIQKKLTVSRYFFVAALASAALGGCSATRQQPAPDANANAAVASPAAQPTQAAEAKPHVTHVPSSEVSSKNTNASILEQMHQANLKEIAVGKIAEEKASSDEVRAYAVQLVNDHTNADQMVTATAQKKGAHLRDSAADRQERSREIGGTENCRRRMALNLIGSFSSRPAPITRNSSASCSRSAKMPPTMTSRR